MKAAVKSLLLGCVFISVPSFADEIIQGKIFRDHPFNLKMNVHKLLDNMLSGGLDFALNQHLTVGVSGGIQPNVLEQTKRDFKLRSKAYSVGGSSTFYLSGLSRDSFYISAGIEDTRAQANSYLESKTKEGDDTKVSRTELAEKTSHTTTASALIGHKWQADYGVHFSAGIGLSHLLSGSNEGEIVYPHNNSRLPVFDKKLRRNTYSAEVAVGIFL
jgi:hypothetical protein